MTIIIKPLFVLAGGAFVLSVLYGLVNFFSGTTSDADSQVVIITLGGVVRVSDQYSPCVCCALRVCCVF